MWLRNWSVEEKLIKASRHSGIEKISIAKAYLIRSLVISQETEDMPLKMLKKSIEIFGDCSRLYH